MIIKAMTLAFPFGLSCKHMGQPSGFFLRFWANLLALIAGLSLVGTGSVSAQELSGIRFSSTSIVNARWVSFGHDSSSINSLLGNPTSVLSFGPIIFGTQTFSASLTNDFGDTFTAGFSLGHSLSSSLRDDDFFVGQTLLHQTFSIVQPAIQYGIQLNAKSRNLDVPFGAGWEIAGTAKLDASMITLVSTGLTCGEVCIAVPNIASTTPVLTHNIKSLSVTGGVEATHVIDASNRLGIEIALGPSWSEVKDTHHLRTDLGSSPHIVYKLFGPRIDMGFVHQTKLNDNLSLEFGVEGSASWEFGTVQFAPSTPSVFPPLPGFANNYSIRASFRINGKF